MKVADPPAERRLRVVPPPPDRSEPGAAPPRWLAESRTPPPPRLHSVPSGAGEAGSAGGVDPASVFAATDPQPRAVPPPSPDPATRRAIAGVIEEAIAASRVLHIDYVDRHG